MKDFVNLPVDGDDIHWPWFLRRGLNFPSGFYSATPLHIAVCNNNVEIAQSLIYHGAVVNSVDSSCVTPLHFAATNGQTALVGLLLDAGANPNAIDQNLESPCMDAASGGHFACLQRLLRGGADLGLKNLYHRTALHRAIVAGTMEVVVYLVGKTLGPDLGFEDDTGNSTLSHALIREPSFILNYAADPRAYIPQSGNILSCAGLRLAPRHLELFLRRLPEELVPTLFSHRHIYYGTPLYAACTGAHTEDNVEILLEAGADLELEGGEHGTPLMGACATGRLKAVKILVAKGAKVSYTRGGETVSALRAAKHHPEIVRWLLVGRLMESRGLITL